MAVIAALTLGVGAAGCGDDDEETAAAPAATATAEAPTEPATLAISATGKKDKPIFEAPATAPGGAVKIEFTNNTADRTDAQLVRIEGDHTYAEVLAELDKAMNSKAVADWFLAGGGVGDTPKGETGSVTQELVPGQYYVIGGENPPKKAVGFEVTETDGAALPETEATIVATEYKFEATGLKAGKNTVKLDNAGKEYHHFLTAELKPGKTADDVKKFFKTEKGAPPFAGKEGDSFGSTVLEGGTSQVVDVEFKKGKYVLFCFIADRAGGPPHVAKGMVSEVDVQ